MNQMEPQRHPTGDEIDALLGNFFKSQMPDPWPAFQRPILRPVFGQSRRPVHRWASVRTRLALAASIAILAVSAWLLPARLTNLGPSGDLPTIDTSKGGADTKNRFPHMPPDMGQPKDKKNDIQFPLPEEGLPGM